MMKGNNSILVGRQSVILAVTVIVIGLAGSAHCQTGGIALLLQKSPVQGGSIAPGAGVHYFGLDTEISLTAVPKRGYRFVYWLGDVIDSTASSTTIYLDAPKIIIAVFERVEYEFLAITEMVQGSEGGGGTVRSAGDYSARGAGAPGAKRPHKRRGPGPAEKDEEEPEEPEEPDEPDFPVPDEPEDFPVPDEPEYTLPVPDEPIPEPTTGLLLALGGMALLRKHRKHHFGGKQK